MAAPRRENNPARKITLKDPYADFKPGYLGTIAGHTTPEDVKASRTHNVHRSNEMAILDAYDDDFEAGKVEVAKYREKHGLK